MADDVTMKMGRVGRSYASISSPPVKGLEPRSPDRANRDPKVVRQISAREAMFGRISYGAGPMQTRYASVTGAGLEPTTIWNVQVQRNNGYPAQWTELCEAIIERDGTLGSVIDTRRFSVVDKPFRVHPARRDELSEALTKIVERIIDQIDSFDQSIEDLLSAPAYGYAVAENVWKEAVKIRVPTLKGSETLTLDVPRSIEWIHWKHVRFDRNTDEPYLVLGSGEYSFPNAKLIFHSSAGTGLIERRGFMGACTWLSAAKRWSERDWLIYGKLFGIPQILAQFPDGKEEYEEHRDKYTQWLKDWGEGIPALLPDSLTVNLTREASGRSGDVHGSIIGWANQEIMKRVLGSTLTVEMGSNGSWAAADTHRDAPYMRSRADARKLAATLRRDLLTPILEVNKLALAKALGVSPEEIIDAVPKCSWRIEREMTPKDRLEVYTKAVNELCLDVDEDQFRDEFGIDAPSPSGKKLRGKPIAIGSGGLAPGLDAAQDGAEPAEKEPAKADAPKPESKAPEDAPGESTEKSEAKKSAAGSKIALAPTDIATIVTVDEARESLLLDPFPEDGDLTVAEFKAKHSEVISEAASAEQGESDTEEK